MSLIILNVAVLILDSIKSIHAISPAFFLGFEYFSVAVFSIEYALRIWSCTENPAYKEIITGRLRFAAKPISLVDLFAILPFYLPFTGLDLRILRLVRMMRVLRAFKIWRYSASLQMLQRVILVKKGQLASALSILILLAVISACFLYYTENHAQPEVFTSIPAAMWWAISTLTTVGYGDIYPITPVGKIIASVISILGIAMFALPTAIIGAGFIQEAEGLKGLRKCPHCGKDIAS